MFRNDHQNTITNFQTLFFQPSNIATCGACGLRVSFHRCSAALMSPCCAGLSQDSRRIFHDANGIVVLKQTAAKKIMLNRTFKEKEVRLQTAASRFLRTIMYI